MAKDLWCWRCRKVVPMVEPHEWTIMEAAREAGTNAIRVLEGAKSERPGHDFTPLSRRADVLSRRFAYLRLGYELFTGVHERGTLNIPHHRTDLYGPECGTCGKPLRTPSARMCAACGAARAERDGTAQGERARCASELVRLHSPDLHSMAIGDVLRGPLPPSALGDPFLDAIADPALGLVHHIGVPSAAARLVQGLFTFYTAVLNDQLTEYFSECDGDALPDVVHWCATIDAHRAQALAGDFLALYPESLWRDSVGRVTFLDEREDETGRSAVEDLAAARWDDVLEIPGCLRRYVEANLDLFETYHREGRALIRSADESVGNSKPPCMSDAEWHKRTAIRR